VRACVGDSVIVDAADVVATRLDVVPERVGALHALLSDAERRRASRIAFVATAADSLSHGAFATVAGGATGAR